MILGKIQNRRASVKLVIYGAAVQEAEVDFVVDTGFTGVITLPPSICSGLMLSYIRPQVAGLANGSPVVLDVYGATLLWDGNERFVEALAMEGEPLIGMTLLDGHDVSMRIGNGGFCIIEPSKERY